MLDFKYTIIKEYAPFFLSGTLLTIKLSVIAILVGFFLGLLLALGRLSCKSWIRIPVICLIESIRGTPLLLQLLITYFGIIPLFMKKPDGILAAAVALSINAGAYIAETIRGGSLSIDAGQKEAASALGLSYGQTMRYVILPQALRSVVPALGTSFVSLIKESSLASVIATPELMYWANAANAQYDRVWETFITTAIIYLLLTIVTSQVLGRLEKK